MFVNVYHETKLFPQKKLNSEEKEGNGSPNDELPVLGVNYLSLLF